jgi:hypothetical protein
MKHRNPPTSESAIGAKKKSGSGPHLKSGDSPTRLMAQQEMTLPERPQREFTEASPAPAPDPPAESDPKRDPKQDADRVLREWYAKYDKFVRSKIHKALEPRFDAEGNPDEANLVRGRKLDLAEELRAGVWAHIAEKWPQYQDRGLKHGPMAWIGTVAVNFVRDYFKVEMNRQRLQPTKSLGSNPEEEEVTAYRYTGETDLLPARPVRPSGFGPDPDEDEEA